MNNSARILIPVGLFIAFAFAHMMARQNELVRYELAVAGRPLLKGRPISLDSVASMVIYSTADNKSIEQSFVPFGDRGQDVLGRTVNRDVQPGEFIMLADLLKESGNTPQLEADEVGIQVPLQGTEFSASQLKIGSRIGFTVEERQPDILVAENPADVAKAEAVAPRLLRPFRLIGIGDEVISVREAGSDNTEDRNSKILTIAVRPNADGTMDENTNTLLRAVSGGSSLRIISVVVLPDTARAQGN